MRTSQCLIRGVWAWLFLVLFGLLSARAQGEPPTEGGQLQEELFAAARGDYDRGEYLEAAERFKKAYQLAPLPRLLQNIGAAYARAARDLRLPISQRLDAARASVSHFEAFEQAMSEPVSPALVARREEVRKLATELERSLTLAAAPPASPSEKPLHRRTWFRGLLVGLAVATGGAAIAVGVLAAPQNPTPPPSATEVRFSLSQPLRF